MDQGETKRAQCEEIEELRRKLNEEIRKKNYDLSAQSVREISEELDHLIIRHSEST